ncbi:hypothetical protein AWB76_02508 [Caballeronia temeraria]|uniref:Uncharacterized protein n=1 Tax=Caballeronia temeraria TaxID=1777137 RepID=A0A158AJA8_9BURK|nr:hypothetical protein [Caballeronia temeraria]SAK57759.1 hypothetical protein AWB76_02508 [Caballeronia temeraria]
MKLAKVRIEYSSGTTIIDRVTLDPATGQVHLAPRMHGLLSKMEESECSPAFSLEYKGYVLPVSLKTDGAYVVSVPPDLRPGLRNRLYAIANPSKDQRQQNGRYLHTLSAASLGGAVGYAHSSSSWDWATAVGTAALVGLGVILWYAGFLHMKGE